MLPYVYSAVRECATTGMPVMRALWLHYPDDPVAVARNDQYLWGRSILVAPVAEKAATARSIYLPRGNWYDFWTNDRLEGGREIRRSIDLETIPLFVAAGTVLPLGSVQQHTDERVDRSLSISIYPGADGSFLLYEDDGRSFNYRKGEWMGTRLIWNDASRTLTLTLAPGSRMLSPLRRTISVNVLGVQKNVTFDGSPADVHF
jgi:alpha-glucosidase/alpha-D-xyloside xylohydrolase